jgi:hypothetical protein
MFNLSELVRGGTLCLSKAGLAEGTNSNTIKINAPNGAGIDFAIGGLLYHKADTDNIAMTALAIQPELYSCLYLVEIDHDGAVALKKGTQVLTADVGNTPLNWPDPTAGSCAIGGFRIDCATGYTFTSGSTDLSATGLTETYYDFIAVPDSPIVA